MSTEQLRTRTSSETDEVYLALFAIQNTVEPVELDGYNPFTKSKYAKLPSILRELKPLLQENGLLLIQLPSVDDDNQPLLVTRLVHVESNQWIEAEMSLTDVGNMQKLGGALTYARRYSVAAIFNLVADEDDDGNASSQPTATKQAGHRQSKPVAPAKASKPAVPKVAGNGNADLHWSQVPANQTLLLEKAMEMGVSGAQEFFGLLDIKVESKDGLATAWSSDRIKSYSSGKQLLADIKQRFSDKS